MITCLGDALGKMRALALQLPKHRGEQDRSTGDSTARC